MKQPRSNAEERLRLFVEHYIADRGASPTDSWIAATKYKGSRANAHKHASRYLKRARERGLIDKRIERVAKAMKADEVIEQLSALARGEAPETAALLEIGEKTDVGEFVTFNQGGGFTIDLEEAKRKGLLKFVRKLSHDKETGAPVVELESRADAYKSVASIRKGALEDMARIHGLEKRDETPAVQSLTIGTVLMELPGGTVRDVARRMLAEGKGDVVEAERVDAE